MNYIENIYICLVAPILIVAICAYERPRKMMLFVMSGMTACLLSSYISTFLAAVHGTDSLAASAEIAPMVEECMKLFPILFYLVVFEPKVEELVGVALMVASGFATLENVCYLVMNGAENVFSLMIRGFGTGAMHVVGGAMVGIGLTFFRKHLYMRIAGIIGLLSLAITFHAIFNLLVSQKGPVAWVGYLIPVVTMFVTLLLRRRRYPMSRPPEA